MIVISQTRHITIISKICVKIKGDDDMKSSVKMLFGLAVGLAIGALGSVEFGIMALPLCGCIGMGFGLILSSNTKKDNE